MISPNRIDFDFAAETRIFSLSWLITLAKYRSNMNKKPDKMFGSIVQKCDKVEQPYCREDPELVPVQGISVLSREVLVFKYKFLQNN